MFGQKTEPVVVRLPAEKPLDELFEDWAGLMRFRNSQASEEESVIFSLNDGKICFALDIVPEKRLVYYDDEDKWIEIVRFMKPKGFREEMRVDHFVFFCPKEGPYKDQFTKFTISSHQHSRNDDSTKRTTEMFSGFTRLLLAGSCDFSVITYYAEFEYRHNISYPIRCPHLPLEELLPRADTHEFVGLKFDQSSCRAIGYTTSTVESLSFEACDFSDARVAIEGTIHARKKPLNLKLEKCNITGDPFPKEIVNGKNLSLKSLTVGLDHLADNSSLACQLCFLPGLESLHFSCRNMELRSIEREQWNSFFEKIKHHPSLKTLHFQFLETHGSNRRMKFRGRLLSSAHNMVKNCPNLSIETISFHTERGTEQLMYDTIKIWRLLRRNARRRAIRESSYRESIISPAIHRAFRQGRYPRDFVFSLLTENADLWR